jgi:lysozyme
MLKMMRVTSVSRSCVDLVKLSERFESKPYLCPAGVPTIGYGTTMYPNGARVRLKDKPINEQVAIQYLLHDLNQKAKRVDSFTRDDITQGMFDALVDFAYNVGEGALQKSTLLKKVNANPHDPTIGMEFMKWVFADGSKNGKDDDGDGLIDEPGEKQKLRGLTLRNEARVKIYYS